MPAAPSRLSALGPVEGAAKSFVGASFTPAVRDLLADCEGTMKAVDGLLELPQAAVDLAEPLERQRFTPAVAELVEAADDKQLSKTINRYGRVDLLCLDELGQMEHDRPGAELLFQVLTEREERSAIATASNEPFSGWTKTFTDPRLCAAIVDRLTFAGQIIETGTTSYRLSHVRTRRAAG